MSEGCVGQLSIYGFNSLNHFITGLISLLTKLDFETSPFHYLNVSATDSAALDPLTTHQVGFRSVVFNFLSLMVYYKNKDMTVAYLLNVEMLRTIAHWLKMTIERRMDNVMSVRIFHCECESYPVYNFWLCDYKHTDEPQIRSRKRQWWLQHVYITKWKVGVMYPDLPKTANAAYNDWWLTDSYRNPPLYSTC